MYSIFMAYSWDEGILYVNDSGLLLNYVNVSVYPQSIIYDNSTPFLLSPSFLISLHYHSNISRLLEEVEIFPSQVFHCRLLTNSTPKNTVVKYDTFSSTVFQGSIPEFSIMVSVSAEIYLGVSSLSTEEASYYVVSEGSFSLPERVELYSYRTSHLTVESKIPSEFTVSVLINSTPYFSGGFCGTANITLPQAVFITNVTVSVSAFQKTITAAVYMVQPFLAPEVLSIMGKPMLFVNSTVSVSVAGGGVPASVGEGGVVLLSSEGCVNASASVVLGSIYLSFIPVSEEVSVGLWISSGALSGEAEVSIKVGEKPELIAVSDPISMTVDIVVAPEPDIILNGSIKTSGMWSMEENITLKKPASVFVPFIAEVSVSVDKLGETKIIHIPAPTTASFSLIIPLLLFIKVTLLGGEEVMGEKK